MFNPKISIIIPTYNRAYILWRALLSIQKQTLSNWEMLVVDDGSTDDTVKLMAEFQDDHRIHCFQQAKKGPSAARNHGLSKANGEIITYLDSDDELYPNAFASICRFFETSPKITWGVYNHNRSLELLSNDYKTKEFKVAANTQHTRVTLQDFYDWRIKSHSGIFHKREPFQGHLEWLSGIFIEDLEFIMQLAALDEQGFAHLSQTLLNYRQKYGSDGLCSSANYHIWEHSFKTIYERHKNDPLMKNPEVYLERVNRYRELCELEKKGEAPPQVLKYFPEVFFEG